jgi:hypothetical protein
VLKHGNFALSIDQTGKGPNWVEQKVSHDIQIADDKHYVPCAHAELNSKQSVASGSLQANSKGGGGTRVVKLSCSCWRTRRQKL